MSAVFWKTLAFFGKISTCTQSNSITDESITGQNRASGLLQIDLKSEKTTMTFADMTSP